jgi:hypothetical protein
LNQQESILIQQTILALEGDYSQRIIVERLWRKGCLTKDIASGNLRITQYGEVQLKKLKEHLAKTLVKETQKS